MIGFNNTFGWVYKNNVSGVLSPADPDLILQWLVDYDGDFELVDSVGVLDKVEVTDVPVANFDGTQFSDTPYYLNFGTSDYSVSFWIKPSAIDDFRQVIDGRDGNDDGFRVMITASGFAVSHNEVDLYINSVLVVDEWAFIEIYRSGSTLNAKVNGTIENSAPISGSIDVATPVRIGCASISLSQYYIGRLAQVCVECTKGGINYPCTTIPFYDVSVTNGVPNGNHATSTPATDPTIVPDDEIGESYELRYGYTGSVPALNELVGGERLDALNLLPIEDKGSVDGERVHNGCSVTIRTTDPIYTSGTINFFSADGATADKKTFADLQAHPNGQYGLYLRSSNKNTGSAGNCHMFELGQYPFDYTPTQSGYNKNLKYWTVCDSFADPLEIAYDLDGTAIIDLDGSVLIEPPA